MLIILSAASFEHASKTSVRATAIRFTSTDNDKSSVCRTSASVIIFAKAEREVLDILVRSSCKGRLVVQGLKETLDFVNYGC